jgi:hypothetical protein
VLTRSTPREVIAYTLRQTQRDLRDGLVHWAAQGTSFVRKFAGLYIEPENTDLEDVYGAEVELACVADVIQANARVHGDAVDWQVWQQIVGLRASDMLSSYSRLAHALDEEQERELEQEQERQVQVERPPPLHARTPAVSPEAKKLATGGSLAPGELVTMRDFFAEFGVDFPSQLSTRLFCTSEFQRTVRMSTAADVSASFLPSATWVVSTRFCDGLVLISAFEANVLIGNFRRGLANSNTLHLFMPICQRGQRTRLFQELAVPSAERQEWVVSVELSVVAAELYFLEPADRDRFEAEAGAHKTAVRTVIEARWGDSSGARHVGSDMAKWLVQE